MPVPSSLTLPKGGEDDKTVLDKSSANQQEEQENHNNKLFVGALSSNTTKETLMSFFGEFGEILECTIMKDFNKYSRGFGFITFKEPESVQKILCRHADEPIVIDDKTIDPKLAVPKRNNKGTSNSQVRRIFVGGLSSDTDQEDIRSFFLKFGNIEEVQLMYDKHTSRHRGFAFVTFQEIGPAAKVCAIQYHDLKNKKVEVKVAQSKEALAQQQADKDRAAGISQGFPSAAPFNVSPTFPPFYSPHYHHMAYYGGFGFHGDHHLPSPPFFSPGFNGIPPGPYFMRAGLPEHSPLPLSSPDFLSDHFQGLAIIGNPYMSPSGSPPHGFPHFTSNGVGGADGSYSPPTHKERTSPINGYSQVSNYQSSQTSSFSSTQQQQQLSSDNTN